MKIILTREKDFEGKVSLDEIFAHPNFARKLVKLNDATVQVKNKNLSMEFKGTTIEFTGFRAFKIVKGDQTLIERKGPNMLNGLTFIFPLTNFGEKCWKVAKTSKKSLFEVANELDIRKKSTTDKKNPAKK